MPSYNKTIIAGNLTRDPEVRYTPKGAAVCDICIAINRKYKTDSGEQREEVTFCDVVLWSRLAELAGQYLKKGSCVLIDGRLATQSWEDKQTGQKRSKLQIVGEQMQFLDGKQDSEGGGREGSRESSRARSTQRSEPQTKAQPDVLDDDDIPF